MYVFGGVTRISGSERVCQVEEKLDGADGEVDIFDAHSHRWSILSIDESSARPHCIAEKSCIYNDCVIPFSCVDYLLLQ